MKMALGRILEGVGKNLDEHNKKWSLFSSKKKKWGVSIYILTDGVWQSGPQPLCGVEEPIAKIVEKLTEYDSLSSKVGIQFICFGNDPVGTARFGQLDSDLERFGINMYVMVLTIATWLG
jgi:hypothetical protein